MNNIEEYEIKEFDNRWKISDPKKRIREIVLHEDEHENEFRKTFLRGDEHEIDFRNVIFGVLDQVPKRRNISNIKFEKNTPQWIQNGFPEEFEKAVLAITNIFKYIEIKPNIRGGAPVIKGTRITVSQILAELGDNQNLAEISKELSLKKRNLQHIMHALAVVLDKSYAK